MGHSQPLFLYFCLLCILIVQLVDKLLLMMGFEPRSFGVEMTALPTEPPPLPKAIALTSIKIRLYITDRSSFKINSYNFWQTKHLTTVYVSVNHWKNSSNYKSKYLIMTVPIVSAFWNKECHLAPIIKHRRSGNLANKWHCSCECLLMRLTFGQVAL